MTDDGGRPEGLRARKLAATRATIERTAIRLALEHGYDNVTVEMICDASLVSPRTFFNYFGSKEGVILGPAPMTTEGDAHTFVHAGSDDIVLDLVTAMAAPLMGDRLDQDLLRSRFLIITNTPELLGKQMEWMTAQENQLIELVLDRFRNAGRPVDDLRDEAGMVVALAFTALRYTLQKIFAEPDLTRVGPPSLSARETLTHATELMSAIVKGSDG